MHQLTISHLIDDPQFYLFGFDGNDAMFVRMNRDCYVKSIFFDERIVTIDDNAVRVPIAKLDTAIAERGKPVSCIGWIFHMAHTGSTLLARALDRPGASLVIREPVTLRALGVEAGAVRDYPNDLIWSEKLRVALAMLGRPFSEAEGVLVKANVPVNAIIADLLATSIEPKAILLHFGLDDYLIAILRSDNHRRWVEHIFAEMNIGAWAETSATKDLLVAEKAATLWLFQIRAFVQSLAANPGIRSLDANILFDQPAMCLKHASEYFGSAMEDDEVERIIASDLFSTYSKNPNARFDNHHRLARKAETRAGLDDELRLARKWIEPHLTNSPLPARLAQPLCGENAPLL